MMLARLSIALVMLAGCASHRSEPFDWDWTPVEAAPLRWSYPQAQPLWTYPTDEQLELRNHYRPPTLTLV